MVTTMCGLDMGSRFNDENGGNYMETTTMVDAKRRRSRADTTPGPGGGQFEPKPYILAP